MMLRHEWLNAPIKRLFGYLPLLMMPAGLVMAQSLESVVTTDGSAGEVHLASSTVDEDPHAHHRLMMQSSQLRQSRHRYAVPDLALVDSEGKTVALNDYLTTEDKPVLLNFIFTSCTTICPLLSATFHEVQQQLGDERDEVQMISITIDPEYDTPAKLRAYAERYGAGDQWQFLTGAPDDIVAVQKAFDSYRGSKVNHVPVTFMKAKGADEWLRLDGMASASDILQAYRDLVGG